MLGPTHTRLTAAANASWRLAAACEPSLGPMVSSCTHKPFTGERYKIVCVCLQVVAVMGPSGAGGPQPLILSTICAADSQHDLQ